MNNVKSISISVEDENGNQLFSSHEHDINEIRSFDNHGLRIGDRLLVRKKEYLITDFFIYTDLTEHRSDKIVRIAIVVNDRVG